MILSKDQFWNVKAREDAEEQRLRSAIDVLERNINLGQRTLSLRSAPGFKDFEQAVRGIRTSLLKQIVESDLSHEAIRELRGRAQAYGEFLTILTDTERSIEQLAERLQGYKEDLKALGERRPQKVNR